MDSYPNPSDWRRKTYETCFEAKLHGFNLDSVCLACARFCLSGLRLRPYIRIRTPGNTKCFCKEAGTCVCYWSRIRAKFDLVSAEDGCIGPNQIHDLLKALRDPAPLELEDVEECLAVVGDGAKEEDTMPRIEPLPFEKWFRQYYDEFEEGDKDRV